MADEKSQYLREHYESTSSHSIHTLTSKDDWMTEIEEDKLSLPLSDEEALSFKPWERTEREFIRQNYKDTSIFSSNIDSFPGKGSPIQNHDIFSAVKRKCFGNVNEIENDYYGMENLEEVIGIHNQGEKFCPHDSCPEKYCLYARLGNASSFNLNRDVSKKSEMLSSYHDYQRLKTQKTSEYFKGISDSKLRGYFGVEGLHMKQTTLEVDKHGNVELSKEESVVNEMNEFSHNASFLFDKKSRESDENMMSLSEKRKENLPSFWWLNTHSRNINENDNCNSAKSLDMETESSIGKSDKINVFCQEANQLVNHSFNLLSKKPTHIHADSSIIPLKATNGNSYSAESGHQKYFSFKKNDFDIKREWWKDVKRVNLPDSSYGFTQKKFEMTPKNVHQSENKINCSSSIKENDPAIEVNIPKCDSSGIKLPTVYDKDMKESEMHRNIKLEDAQKNTLDMENLEKGDKLLNKSTFESSITGNGTITRLNINNSEETVDQEDRQPKSKDLHENFIKSVRLENRFTCDAMSILKSQGNGNVENGKLVIEKCKDSGIHDINHESVAQNENGDTNNELENAEFSADYESMLVLEVIKIENEVINERNRENLPENSTEMMDKSLKDFTGNAYEKNGDLTEISDHSKKTKVEILIETGKEASYEKDSFITNADEKDVKVNALEFPKCEEIKEATEHSSDKIGGDESKSDIYCKSDVDVSDKKYTFTGEEKYFKSKDRKSFEKYIESFDKCMPHEQNSENEVIHCDENPINKERFENFIKIEFDSKISVQELSKGSIGGMKNSHVIDNKCDYLPEKYPYSMNSEEDLEKETNMTQSMKETSLKIDTAKEQILLPEREDDLQLYKEKPSVSIEYLENPVSFHLESNGERAVDLDSEKLLDNLEYLLSEGKDQVMGEKKILKIPKERPFILENAVVLGNQDSANEGLKNSSSSQVLDGIINSINSSSFQGLIQDQAFEKDGINVEKLLKLNSSYLTETSEIKPVSCHFSETFNLKEDPDLYDCFMGDHSEDLCCELQNHSVTAEEDDISTNELQCKVFSNLSDKESNNWTVKMKGSQRRCIRNEESGSLNICIQEKNESPDTAMKVASPTFCSLINGWNLVLMRNAMNMNFVQIQFQNIRVHKSTITLLKSFIYNVGKEKYNNVHLHSCHQNVDFKQETGITADEDINLNIESLDIAMVGVNKLDKSLNESDPCNFVKVMGLDYNKDLVNSCKLSDTAKNNHVRNYKEIEKWLLDVGECPNEFSAELFVYNKTENYDAMLKNASLRTGESLKEINLGVNKNSPSEGETQWRQSKNYEIQNNSFEIDMKYKELDEFAKKADEPTYIPFHQEYIKTVDTSNEENQENVWISDKKFSCSTSLNIAESLNLGDQGSPFEDESHYHFNSWEVATVAKQSESRPVEDDTGHSISLGICSLTKNEDKVSSSVDEKKNEEDSQPTDDNIGYKGCLCKPLENDDEPSSTIDEEEQDSSLSISSREKMAGEEILKCDTNVVREDYDDISLDSYLSVIIDEHCKSEEPTHTLKCGHPKYKTLAIVNAECQTKISGLTDTFHTRTCVDHLILSGNEYEVCQTYQNKRDIEGLNLEVGRNKILKCMDFDNSSYDSKQKSEYSENQPKKRTSSELHISVAEKDDFPIKKIKLDALEENIDKVLQLEEDEWNEITSDRITIKETLDQKVPDITPMIICQGMKEKDAKECLTKTLHEEHDANIREVPSVHKISQRKSVLRLGLSKRARPRPLHKVQ